MPRRRLVVLTIIAGLATAQNQFDRLQKDHARQMLKDLPDGIRKHVRPDYGYEEQMIGDRCFVNGRAAQQSREGKGDPADW